MIKKDVISTKTKKIQRLAMLFLPIALVAYQPKPLAAPSVSLSKPMGAANQQSDIPPIPLSDIRRFATVIAQIKHFYVKPVSYEQLFNNAIRGMLLNLDPHSSYLDEKAMKELHTMTTGQFSGIGIEIMPENDYIRVVSPIDDSPAAQAGLRAGDLIIQIDDKLVKKMPSSEAIGLMRGKKGSTVKLTVLRKKNTKPLAFSIKRDTIKIKTVKSRWLEDGFGYIRIAFFHNQTQEDLEKAINYLNKTAKHHHLKGVVIDLRNNPGGLLTAAIQVSDTFLKYPQNKHHNLIVYTKGKIPGADIQAKITNRTTQLNGVPLVVLINQGSASASEIVAGALQAYRRAIIVGTRSFGKGSVQTVLPTSEKTAVKLTTALYYTPSGRSIQAQGIEPDIAIPSIALPKSVLKTNDTQSLTIVESSLAGHLENENSSTLIDDDDDKTKANKKETIPAELQLAHKDFQLFQALNLLKGLNAVKS